MGCRMNQNLYPAKNAKGFAKNAKSDSTWLWKNSFINLLFPCNYNAKTMEQQSNETIDNLLTFLS